MPHEAAAFCLALVASLGFMPLAIRTGHRYRLLDYPVGWKKQAKATPYIGGGAVMLAFLLTAVTVGGELSRFWPLFLIALLIGAVGMMDDNRGLSPSVKILVEVGAATFLWASGLGWSIFSSEVANLVLTNLWVLALVNAMNLLDLMDGVAGTVAAVASGGVGVLAAIKGDPFLAILAFALSGACAGFLAQNLRSPARIYLGDCGTLATGFVLAGLIAGLPVEGQAGWAIALLAAIPLFGLPLFDLALRIVLRLRRGVSVLTPGPDSVANWLKASLGSPRKVALALGGAQAVLSAFSIAALGLGEEAVVSLSVMCALTAVLLGKVITDSSWALEGHAAAGFAPKAASVTTMLAPDPYPQEPEKALAGL